MSRHFRAVIGIFLVFLFGCVAGWISASVEHLRVADQILQGGPDKMGELLERHLTGNLSLDPEQKTKIHQLVLDNVAERKNIQKQIQPQVQALNRETYFSIHSVLRPDQQKLFKENVTTLMRKRQGKEAKSPDAITTPVPTDVGASAATTNTP